MKPLHPKLTAHNDFGQAGRQCPRPGIRLPGWVLVRWVVGLLVACFVCPSPLSYAQDGLRPALAQAGPTKCELTFHGAARRVSGSFAILDTGNCRVAIDCGAFYPDGTGTDEERAAEARKRNTGLPDGAKQLSALLVTHAHIDHIGRLPLLVRSGFRQPVFLTQETADLAALMLAMQLRYDDSASRAWRWSTRVPPRQSQGQERSACESSEPSTDRGPKLHWRRDCEWDQKIAVRNLAETQGTFSVAEKRVLGQGFDFASPCQVCASLELRALVSLFKPISTDSEFEVAPGVHATALNAGHIPGSCSWLVRVSLPQRDMTLLFSGDLGNSSSTLISGPLAAPPVDLAVLETTYGSPSQGESAADEQSRFRMTIGDAIAAGDLVWIPAFALDRTQKVLHQIAIAQSDGTLPPQLCVYVPSPSANGITKQYLRWHQEAVFRPGLPALKTLLEPETTVTSPGPIRSIESRHGVIVITTSGMLDEAFSRELLPKLVKRDDVEILLVGYQDPGTPGGRLERAVNESAGGPVEIEIDGAPQPLKATVRRFRSFSAHARPDDMDRWLVNVPRSSRLILVHGDPAQLGGRRASLMASGWRDVVIAEEGKTLVLDCGPVDSRQEEPTPNGGGR